MRILLVEDDVKLNEALKFQLEKEAFTVDSCFDGEEALYYIRESLYDLILLDRMLPRKDGLFVLRTLRGEGSQVPVILLTALGEVSDRITGLDCGADDYLVKPFDFEELCARIRSILRRPKQLASSAVLSFDDLHLDLQALRLTGPQNSCSLSPREASLLETFLRNPGQSLTRALLLNRVWGIDSEVEEGNLDNYIYFLRRRIRAVGSRVCLLTVRSIGYCLSLLPEAAEPSASLGGKSV